MKYFRITLAQIEDLIERGNGATEGELKLLWNDLSEAITINEENIKLSNPIKTEQLSESFLESINSIDE